MPYTSDWTPIPETSNPRFGCPECRSREVSFREWESSDGAHDDTQYWCATCTNSWWVEGADA